jgi:hypothetical protein
VVASRATAAFTRGELMRFGIKAAFTAAVAGPAIAAVMLTGVGPANAAVTTAKAPTTSSWGGFQNCNPWFQNQNPFRNQREQWNLSGDNTVVVNENGSSMTWSYSVDFTQRGGCLSGTLDDGYFPFAGPLHGTVSGNHVTFTFRYPGSGSQGTRTYNGYIDRHGDVFGTWSDSGDGASGTWHLTGDAHHACQRYFWWAPNRACFLY